MVRTPSKKYVIIGILIFLPLLFSQSQSSARILSDDFITAKAAFLMDTNTGAVLYEKNPDLPLPPASTTKVMTAIVALERRPLNALLKVNKNVTRVPGCKIGVRAGEEWRMEDLLSGILLNSANDASLVVAEGAAGYVEEFVRLMNLKAREIGAYNTRFANPHGLDQKNHYTTARDMALIFKYAMNNPVLYKILQTKIMWIRGPNSRLIHLKNHNKLLGNFKGMIGGKTGYTSQAKRCFVGEASRHGKDLLVCVFGSQDHFIDAARLLDYGFNGNIKERSYNSIRIQNIHSSTFNGQKGAYILQVASFANKGRALDLKQVLLEKGYPSFIEHASFENGVIRYRVKVGFYSDLESAKKAKERIRRHFGICSLILHQKLAHIL